jgi:hypothetical protein
VTRFARFADHILQARGSKPMRYLEIGACQGHSTAFVYGILNGDARITVVDPFVEFPEIDEAIMRHAQEVFSANTKAMHAEGKVRVLSHEISVQCSTGSAQRSRHNMTAKLLSVKRAHPSDRRWFLSQPLLRPSQAPRRSLTTNRVIEDPKGRA